MKFAPVSWLASKNGRSWKNGRPRPFMPSLIRLCLRPSRKNPVARCCVLAYSCAAARELHPLPCLPRVRRTREPISKALWM